MRIGLISDTHGRLRPSVFAAFEGVDLILHAGDVGPIDVITELEAIAPVHAVLGNTDSWDLAPRVRDVVELELEGSRVAMVHGHMLGAPTPVKLRAVFPNADIIVYGHTHKPLTDEIDGKLVVNPGAAGPARFNLQPSVAILTLDRGSHPRVHFQPLLD